MQPYLGAPRTDSCKIWCARVFSIMCYWSMVMKMLKCKNKNLMTSHYGTLWKGLTLGMAFWCWYIGYLLMTSNFEVKNENFEVKNENFGVKNENFESKMKMHTQKSNENPFCGIWWLKLWHLHYLNKTTFFKTKWRVHFLSGPAFSGTHSLVHMDP